MTNKQYRRYTANGYSHDRLKDQVRKLIKERDFNRKQAQKIIAASIDYSSWAAIINEPIDFSRDLFLRDGLSNKEYYQTRLNEYLEEHQLEDTLQNYRDFLLSRATVIAALHKNQSDLTFNIRSVDDILNEVCKKFRKMGLEAFLPRNLTDDALSILIFHLDIFLKKPHKFSVKKNREGQEVVRFIADKILAIKAFTSLQNPSQLNGKFTISEDEYLNSILCYTMHLVTEKVSRSTYINISQPTLTEILDSNSFLTMEFSDEAIKILNEYLENVDNDQPDID